MALSLTLEPDDRDPTDIPTLYKMDVLDLAMGMYVYKLDRPWTDTPLPFQGFKLSDEEELAIIKQHCEHVFIDADRCDQDEELIKQLGIAHEKDDADEESGETVAYPYQSDIKTELVAAKNIYQESAEKITDLFESVRAGESMKVPVVRETVSGIMESVLRNPDAFMLLRNMKELDESSYLHAIDACALSTAFGRHLGYRKKDLTEISMGALLFDIGRTKLPPELLKKQGELTEEEKKLEQKHVEYGLEILKEAGGVPPATLLMVASHHERVDGSGYPRGLVGDSIPIYGRMAAIVDYYDEITSGRNRKAVISAHKAISELYRHRDTSFNEELVEQFIQCLGVYPTGTLVELNTGEVAIVLSQNELRRLRPHVMLILDCDKKPLDNCQTIDLMMQTNDADEGHLEIERSVEAEDYGIDPGDYYL